MKDYINRLARGKYVYQMPELIARDGNIDTTVVTGEVSEYQFVLSSEDRIQDLLFSTNPRVKLTEHSFAGKEQVISYQVDARELEPGSIIEGQFQVVSNAGEMSVLYAFHVIEQYFETSLGKAFNLFHFTNLVHVAPEEAKNIFLSDRFVTVFINEDEHLKNIYSSLKNQPNTEAAMEEFLLVLRKKTQVMVEISDQKKVYEDFHNNQKECTVIHKSTWGYLELNVSTDAPFIELSVDKIHTDEFTGGKYELFYVLNKSKLHAGRNFGKIFIYNFYEKFEIEIEVDYRQELQEPRDMQLFPENALEIKKAKLGLTKAYLDYRMKKSDIRSWISKSNQILDRIRGIDGNLVFFNLVQAQMYLLEKREEDGKWLLEHAKAAVLSDIDSHVELYCYYLYVNSLLMHSEEYTREAAEIVTKYYENGYDSWRMLWLLFYLKGGQGSNQSVKLIRIKDTFHDGCTSPIMYYEACLILNQQPQLLRVLNHFELKVMTFGIRYGIIQEKLAKQFADVAGNEKVATPECMELLKKIYDLYENDQILTVLVTHMIRNACIGQESFPYYEKGVLRGLRITRLYEYYLASVCREYDRKLPKVVLMYFEFENELEYRLKAYLYANILMNKASYGDIYQSYERYMELFVYEQLKERHIDDSLVILYRELWKKQLITQDTCAYMAKLLYMHKFTCFDKGVQAVCVKHKEQKEPILYPLVEQEVYVPMYTEGCSVVFVCEDGIIRKDSVNYEVEKVFENMPLMDEILPMIEENEGINLYRARNFAVRGDYSAEAVLSWLHMLDNKLMNDDFHMTVNSWMIHYYFEYYTGDDFKEMYGQIIKSNLKLQESKELIETCINFGLNKEAYELIQIYGYDHIMPARLFRLVKYMIGIQGSEYDTFLLDIGAFIFTNRVYDEDVLNYMMDYYKGTNDDMYQMWKACLNFSMDVNKLSERMLAQFLFTGEHTGRMTEVFGNFYGQGARGNVVLAYISYNAYLYLVHQKKANDIVFQAIEDAFEENRELPDTCYIAWFKHMTEILPEQFTEEKVRTAQKILNILCRDDKLFAFYRKFKGILEIPYNAIDKTVIEFRANPDCKVEIHYTYDSDDAQHYEVEIMKPVAGGIFTRPFTLLYGDKLTYYFTVTGAGQDMTTEKFSHECGELNPEQSESRYDYINDCLASKELHDMVTLKKMMRNYSVKNYVTKQLFKPMKG